MNPSCRKLTGLALAILITPLSICAQTTQGLPQYSETRTKRFPEIPYCNPDRPILNVASEVALAWGKELIASRSVEGWCWVGLAAGKNNPEALTFGASLIYSRGDERTAFSWFLDAAKLGYQPAQRQVALMYVNGDGVQLDKNEALRWYRASMVKEGERQQAADQKKQAGVTLRQLVGAGIAVAALAWLFSNMSSAASSSSNYESGETDFVKRHNQQLDREEEAYRNDLARLRVQANQAGDPAN